MWILPNPFKENETFEKFTTLDTCAFQNAFHDEEQRARNPQQEIEENEQRFRTELILRPELFCVQNPLIYTATVHSSVVFKYQ